MLRLFRKRVAPSLGFRSFCLSAFPAIVALEVRYKDVLGERHLADEVLFSEQPYFDDGVLGKCVVVSFSSYITPFTFLCDRVQEKAKLAADRSNLPCFLSTEYAQLPGWRKKGTM